MSKVTELDQPLEGPPVGELCPPQNLRRLAAATVTQALRDLKKSSSQPRRALSALCWLTDPRSDFLLYLEVMDADNLDIFKVLTSGNARKA